MTETRPQYATTTSGSPVRVVSGSPTLDPALAEYFRVRWRACMTELHYIAPLLGWSDRLPRKPE